MTPPPPPPPPPLMFANERSKRVLAALVRQYIASGEPVASSLLAATAGLGVSSATVRNMLAQLEEAGYVSQPHTSAGRIPTDLGYRFYVDLLLEQRHTRRGASIVEARLRRDGSKTVIEELLPQVSHVLSQTARGVGFAIRPAHEDAVFERVEFVPLSASRVMVVIIAKGGHVLQKVINVSSEPLTADELRQAANYLNAEFSGLPLHRAREAVLRAPSTRSGCSTTRCWRARCSWHRAPSTFFRSARSSVRSTSKARRPSSKPVRD